LKESVRALTFGDRILGQESMAMSFDLVTSSRATRGVRRGSRDHVRCRGALRDAAPFL